MHITFVKKILDDGQLCKKCREVHERLESDGVMPLINEVVIADSRDAESAGMKLARQYQVERAPFFIVEQEKKQLVFDVYFKLRKHLVKNGALSLQAKAL